MNARTQILALTISAASFLVSAAEVGDMRLAELPAACRKEIESGAYTGLRDIKVVELKVLAWYRARDNRPWYVDCALCWAEVTTCGGRRWVLVSMGRNPQGLRPDDLQWGSDCVWDAGWNDWFVYYQKPPTNPDILSDLTNFLGLLKDDDWEILQRGVAQSDWLKVVGTNPPKIFPNKAAPADAKTAP